MTDLSIASTPAAIEAVVAADKAAARADVTVAAVRSQEGAHRVATVLAEIWPVPGRTAAVAPELLWAMAHAGNYVALAVRDDRPVGGAFAFFGEDADGRFLHSHMTGVTPGLQGASVGFAIKQHQRAWALERGVDRITWTFDPLVARNGYFNVVKLGASITRYYTDFYGALDDGINAGDETDRCLVTWDLESPGARAGADGSGTPADVEALLAAGAQTLLSVGDGDRPVLHDRVAGTAAALLCQVPFDIVALRAADPGLAAEWRQALRDVVGPALQQGRSIVDVGRGGWYVVR
jgi:predicted GNAT superfamily acetyltransferase